MFPLDFLFDFMIFFYFFDFLSSSFNSLHAVARSVFIMKCIWIVAQIHQADGDVVDDVAAAAAQTINNCYKSTF